MPRKARESPVRCPNPKCNVPLILDDGGIIPWHTLSGYLANYPPVGDAGLNRYSAIDAVCPAVGEKFQPAGKER